jgi:hypothetical protein
VAAIQRNIKVLVDALDKARHASLDPPHAPPIELVKVVRTGRPGRPRHKINMAVVKQSIQLRTPLSKIATKVLKTTSRRTLVRRMQEEGLHIEATAENPALLHDPHSGMTVVTDEELDSLVATILQDFPNHGRIMMDGALFAQGVRVSSKRIRESLNRVKGAPAVFGRRKIHRKKYYVPGANSLWHHDGQHGK